jgi:hypothetical protein
MVLMLKKENIIGKLTRYEPEDKKIEISKLPSQLYSDSSTSMQLFRAPSS